MIKHIDTLRARAFVVIVALLIVSNAAALWIFMLRHDDAVDTLYDAMYAEQAAIVVQLMDRLPAAQRKGVADALGGSLIRVAVGTTPPTFERKIDDGVRAKRIGDLINNFLNRPVEERARIEVNRRRYGLDDGAYGNRPEGRKEAISEQIVEQVLQQADNQGRVEVSTMLSDGVHLSVSGRLLSVPHFSLPQLFPSLLALTGSALAIAFWLLGRFIAPLLLLEGAARRLAADINSPSLPEGGPSEVRSATAAFNALQSRIKQLIADRSATAAVIAHDLGTPITRLRLRAFDVGDVGVRERILSDIDQMQGMMAGALALSRLDFETEKTQKTDLVSLVQSVCEDLTDLGANVGFVTEDAVTVETKPLLLKRAIMNLTENAVKYGRRAEIFLLPGHSSVTISVRDDGPGIDESQWEEAMKPFRRLGKHPQDVKGSGLGLTIARRIVEDLGGTLEREDVSLRRFGVRVYLPVSH